jgi:hypothetical protein
LDFAVTGACSGRVAIRVEPDAPPDPDAGPDLSLVLMALGRSVEVEPELPAAAPILLRQAAHVHSRRLGPETVGPRALKSLMMFTSSLSVITGR